jgi:glycosyltransferase involved in cell wall biosynthesis
MKSTSSGTVGVAILLDNDYTIDNRVRRSAELLASQGYTVHLFAMKSRSPEIPDEEVQQGVHVHRILEADDMDYHLPRRWFRALRKIWLMRKAFPDFSIVHSNDIYTLPLGWLLALLNGAKLVYDSHEYWAAALAHNRNKLLNLAAMQGQKKHVRQAKRCQTLLNMEPWLIRRCDAMITVSEGISDALSKQQTSQQSKPVVIRNVSCYLTDAETLALEKRYHRLFNLPENTRVVLYQGVVKRGRGLEPMIKALKAIGACADLNAVFVMMGPLNNPSYLDELMEQAAPGTVFYKESVPACEVEAWTASADIGVVASPRSHDNFVFSLPNKFFSYIQSGVPILTNDLPEMTKLLSIYRIGETTDITDDEAIVETLKQMLRPGGLAEFHKNMALAKTDLCWEKEQLVLARLYAGLMESPVPNTKTTTSALHWSPNE